MTTEPPPPGPADPAAVRGPRPLRRRGAGRVIGGVAAGIADYLNVDPLLVRATFVGLMIFGGAGLVLYVGGWLLIPAEGERHAPIEGALRRIGLAPQRLIAVAIFVAAGIVLLSWLGRPVAYDLGSPYSPTPFWDGQVILVVLMVFIGLILLRRGGGAVRLEPTQPEQATSAFAPGAPPPAPPTASDWAAAAQTVPVATPRPRASPLGWYVTAAALIAIGLLALVGNVAQVRVLPGQFFGVGLAIVGVGLVVASWWGRGRRLIVPALFILPFALAAAFVTAPLEGGTGDLRYAPANASELRDSYRIVGGRLILDLRELDVSAPVRVAASVAIGQLVVILPPDSRLDVDAHVGAGSSSVLGSVQSGTALVDRYVRGSGSRSFALNLEAGIGEIRVETED